MLTVATELLDVLQVTVASVTFDGSTVAVKAAVPPAESDKVVALNVILVTLTDVVVTVTMQVAVFPPAVAVIVALPAATPVTVPLLTVATELLDVLQVTVASVASVGNTVAVKFAVLPTVTDNVVALNETEVTATVSSSEQALKEKINVTRLKNKNNFFLIII